MQPSCWLRTPHLAASARRVAIAAWQRSPLVPRLPPAASSAAAIAVRAAVLRGGWGPCAAGGGGGSQRAMSGGVPFIDTAKLVCVRACRHLQRAPRSRRGVACSRPSPRRARGRAQLR